MSIQTLQPASVTFRPPRSAASAPRSVAAFGNRVDVLRTLAEVDAIADEWRDLERSTPEATGFQAYAWCRAWMAANADNPRWLILAVRDRDQLVALLPFERERFLGARVVRWLGGPWTQYGDALVADGPRRIEHLAAAWREIASWRDVDLIMLGRVRADAALTALPGLQGRTVVHREWAPLVDVTQTPAKPDKRLRARRRKLAEAGQVTFERVRDSAERVACVREALACKRAWLQSRGLPSSGLFHPNANRFLDALADSGELVVGRLTVGSETAAVELGLETGRTYRSLLGAHTPRYAQGSPGHILIGEMIAWAHREGLGEYDLMVPADPYKRRWSTAEIEVCDHLMAQRLRGQAAALWYRSRPLAKAVYARAPDRLKQLLARLRRGR